MIICDPFISSYKGDRMENVKLNVTVTHTEDERKGLDRLLFEITRDDVTIAFDILTPEWISVEQFRDLAATINGQTKESKSIHLKGLNGDISILSTNEETTFNVSNGSKYCSSSCRFTLLNPICVDAFNKVLAAYEKVAKTK